MLANASIQNATTLQGLLCAAFGGFPAHFVAWSCPNGRIQAFAGMTRVGLERRDAAVVSRRRLVFQFRGHTAFLKISHYGMQHLDVVWGRSLVVMSLS